MYNANGLSPFRGKVDEFIIPVDYFRGGNRVDLTPENKVVAGPPTVYGPKKKDQLQRTKLQQEKTEVFCPPKIKIEKVGMGNGVSSLSLSSILLKKEVEKRSSTKKIKLKEAEENFSHETLSKIWTTYVKEKSDLGENNIAALLEMCQPEILANHKILLKTTNLISKVELKRELPFLLKYLSEKLKNHKISFQIKVDPQKSKEYVYGKKDKFEYLKKINPDIEVLIKEFNLDL